MECWLVGILFGCQAKPSPPTPLSLLDSPRSARPRSAPWPAPPPRCSPPTPGTPPLPWRCRGGAAGSTRRSSLAAVRWSGGGRKGGDRVSGQDTHAYINRAHTTQLTIRTFIQRTGSAVSTVMGPVAVGHKPGPAASACCCCCCCCSRKSGSGEGREGQSIGLPRRVSRMVTWLAPAHTFEGVASAVRRRSGSSARGGGHGAG